MAHTRRWVLAVTTVLVIAPPVASAQTSTTDGVQALLRGEYQRAVHILQPLAERPTDPDPVAQFFFAALQESSRSTVPGCAPSQVRACALYAAAAQATNPFQTQSQTLADAIRGEFGAMAERLCTTDPVMLGDRGKIASPSLAQPDSPALGPTIEASAAYLR